MPFWKGVCCCIECYLTNTSLNVIGTPIHTTNIPKVYPPGRPLAKSLKKLSKVVEDCSPGLILMDTRISRLRQVDRSNPLSKTRGLWPNHIDTKITDSLSISNSAVASYVSPSFVDANNIAFLQYTSGSTGEPKGVMVSFKSLAANIDLNSSYYNSNTQLAEDVVGISWLPQYHDCAYRRYAR